MNGLVQCHKLMSLLFGGDVGVGFEQRVEIDDTGARMQVVELFTHREHSSNVQVSKRRERRTASVPFTGAIIDDGCWRDRGFGRALDELAGKLTDELRQKGVIV